MATFEEKSCFEHYAKCNKCGAYFRYKKDSNVTTDPSNFAYCSKCSKYIWQVGTSDSSQN